MPLAANLQSHDYSFAYQVIQGVWRWTTRMDVSGAAPAFEIRDVISPFGLLRDTTPIPGEVAQAMSESIDELKSQFAPAILIGPPSTLTFTVDEGRGVSEAQSVILTNSGVYGSLLDATLTPAAVYVAVKPASLGNLAFQESGSFDVTADSTDLVAGTYNTTVLVQDTTASNNPQSLPVTIEVRPKATIDATPLALTFNAVKPISGDFPAVPNQTFVVTNTGPASSVLEYLIQRLTCTSQLWLNGFTPVSGTLASGASDTITVSVVPDASLQPGTYTETLRVSGYSSNSYVDVTINLVIT